MKIKKLFKNRIIMLGVLFLLALSVLFGIINMSTTQAFADSETLEQKIVRFTSSDLLDGEQEGGTDIRTFATKYKKDEYRPAGYTGSYPITEIISKVLPIELFYTEGAHVYMGGEYGFIVYTYTNNNGISYFSQFLIIDFTFSLASDKYGTEINNQPTYRMETLIQQFVEVVKDNGTNQWKVIQPESWIGTDIYLKNVYIAANLENENELNSYDNYYDKQADNGDVILYAGVDYCAHTQVGSTNFEPLAKWGIDFIVTKAAEMNPITDKALSFVKDMDSFVDAVGEIYNLQDEKYSTIPPEAKLEFPNLNKEAQKNNPNYTSYSREIYVKQSELNNAAMAKFIPAMNYNDENGFIELQVITAGAPVNSRISFSVGFEAVFQQVISSNFVLTEEGQYDVIPEDFPDSAPVILTHSVDYKMQNSNIKSIKSVNYVDNENDEIADGIAYLLNKSGYNIYKFEPKAEGDLDEQLVFGDYCFYIDRLMTLQPRIRIHLFRSKGVYGELNPNELCLMNREELLAHPYLLDYNDSGSYGDGGELNYTFTNDISTNNLYYVLYTYSFDYLGGSSYFEAKYNFIPSELNISGGNYSFNSGVNSDAYFRVVPSATGNYTITVQGPQQAALYLYETQVGSTKIKEISNDFVLDALLRAGKTYYVRIANLSSNTSGTINIVNGEEIINYQTIFSGLGSNETKYYKFIPHEFSGKYDEEVPNGINVIWYNSSLEPVEFDSNGNVFLSKNNTYYLKVKNIGVSSLSGNIVINYLYENTFNSSLQVVTEGHKQYYAYVIEGANVQGLSLNIVVNINGTSFYNNTIVSSDETILLPIDLTDINFLSGMNTINASVIVNGNTSNPASVPMQQINMTYSTLSSSSYAAEYVYLNCTSSSFNSKVVYIPDTVKMLVINKNSTVTLNGVYFDIGASEEPLIIHFNSTSSLTIKAPLNVPVINSERDILINCKGTIILKGGDGVDNEFYVDLAGDPAICAQNNTVILNGSGSLKLYGGDGGDTYDQEFYNVDFAGDGGTAMEANNLVINVESIYIKGGAGGNGGVGMQGAHGANGTSAGSDGTNGERGGYGGDGGNAGMGVCILGDYCAIYTSNLQIYGGDAGNGGTGGRGGNGGNGANGSTYGNGGNGGDAGSGGVGGDYGIGMIAFNSYDIDNIVYYNASGFIVTLPNNLKIMFETWSADGTPGDGGQPGTPGVGGKGGSGFLGIGAGSDGYNGMPGIKGGSGGNPNAHIYSMSSCSAMAIQNEVANNIIDQNLNLKRYIVRRFGEEKAYELYRICQ